MARLAMPVLPFEVAINTNSFWVVCVSRTASQAFSRDLQQVLPAGTAAGPWITARFRSELIGYKTRP